ncbi:MAG: hypothetical protein NZ898_05775 [Myxococcota bacterium]|nr:hypothetical protein [Myxococcota bacterium]MDW8363711.1 hypothetical protein [Myxococcales bacterium]
MGPRSGWLLAACCWASLHATASAQGGTDALRRAREALASGAFERAAAVLRDAAEGTGTLSRAELPAYFETLALVRAALRDEAGRDAALEALAALEPGHRFAPEVPPSIRRRFEALATGARPRIRLRLEETSRGQFRAQAEIVDTPAALARGMRMHYRVGSGAWNTTEAPEVRVRADRLAAWAELIGPGGVVVAVHGSEEQPIEARCRECDGPAVSSPIPAARPAPAASGGTFPWLPVGIGVGLLAVAVGVGVGLAVSSGEPTVTVVSAPMPAGNR